MSHPKHTSSGRTLLIADDETQHDPDETNPFSFKEFVKSKHFSSLKEKDKKSLDTKYTKNTAGSSLTCNDSLSHERHGLNLGFQEPFFAGLNLDRQEPFFTDPTVEDHFLEDEEEEDWSGSYQPSAVENAHETDLFSSASDSTYDPYSSSSAELSDAGRTFATWQPDDSGNTSNGDSCLAAASNKKTDEDVIAHKDLVEDVLYHPNRSSDEDVREENAQLRRTIKELQKLAKAQTKKMKRLEEELEKRKITEEKEAQALESMVQQVEQNLQLMTKRAIKAENNVARLKQIIIQLQSKLESYRAENEVLQAGESASLKAVKQNAQVASENLHKVASDAQASIKQLISGAQTLQLVSELLKSISRITEVQSEDS